MRPPLSPGLAPGEVGASLAALEVEGFALRGRFTAAAEHDEWCERRLLARIHRYTIKRLRAEIEPVAARDFLRFLLDWQGVSAGARREGPDAVTAVVEQLEGYEAAAGAWESEILPARLAGYEPTWLDDQCLAGHVSRARPAGGPSGAAGDRSAVGRGGERVARGQAAAAGRRRLLAPARARGALAAAVARPPARLSPARGARRTARRPFRRRLLGRAVRAAGRHRQAARDPPPAAIGRARLAVRCRPAQPRRHPDAGAEARGADRQPPALPRRRADRALRCRRGGFYREARRRQRMGRAQGPAARPRPGAARRRAIRACPLSPWERVRVRVFPASLSRRQLCAGRTPSPCPLPGGEGSTA